MLDTLAARWTGLALALLTVVGTLWLALTGDLDLYVHPRYFGFTITMAVVGGLLAVAAVLFLPGHPLGEDAHDAEEVTESTARSPFATAGRVVIVAAATVALLVLSPATLSSRVAGTRELNAASATGDAVQPLELAGADGTGFSVKDWAGLLRQNLPESFFAGKTADVTGFVLDAESEDTFYLSRYLITHCAIDAQPVGIPVHWPGWQDEVEPGGWLSISGAFGANEDPLVDSSVVLTPDATEQVEQPDDPYVY
ncbi:TIGR03943 family protein [Naasia sp. SYSU D00057]|uniref:TIGR03943 family putative permease subunit n=1 Tax=Naasia sp. SYSU D00057 TaxID=2817380 RepID=UPI001B30F670|nr:TIGR03943 family protein [Naasia sp. SYSU D00057]